MILFTIMSIFFMVLIKSSLFDEDFFKLSLFHGFIVKNMAMSPCSFKPFSIYCWYFC